MENCVPCEMGFVCPATARSTAPSSPMDSCAVNTFCQEASQEQLLCPPGTFTASTEGINEDSCTACDPGTSCNQGITTLGACAPGYYCLSRTYDIYETPCPDNTFTASTSLSTKSGCDPCNTLGKYCMEGSGAETDCKPGYKCPGNQAGILPCPAGSYSATGQSDCTACPQGSTCPAGYHEINPISCPVGYYMDVSGSSGPCLACPPGRYCAGSGTITPSVCANGKWSMGASGSCDDCPAGYYSASGVKTVCPAGSYCVAGSGAPTVCEEGYYCPTGAETHITCPPGQYSAAGAASCSVADPGHFTIQRQSKTQMDANACAAGFYCESGSKGSIHKPCPAGYYVNTGFNVETDCKPCPAGYYCVEGSNNANKIICPTGHYCPEGSAIPSRCYRGTYNDLTGKSAPADCLACPAGKVCSQDGLTNSDLTCDPGYYCIQGASMSQPLDGIIGGLCGEGTYCPRGASVPLVCPSGTFNVFKGCKSSDDCLNCPFGFVCNDNNGTNQLCEPGYYCPGGTSTPTLKKPAAGYHDIAGQGDQIPCWPSTYSPSEGQNSCTQCVAGGYCPSSALASPIACPAGSFCPTGSVQPLYCHEGTYRATTGAAVDTDCTTCPGGEYCRNIGATAYSGPCDAGFYCTEGAFHSSPAYTSDLVRARFGPCPTGKYCPAESVTPTDCGVGTYSNATCNKQVSDCNDCIPGQYCDSLAMDEPTGYCKVGYYCPVKSTAEDPNICPKGSYCPAGSSMPLKCPIGTYQDEEGKGDCKGCPQGNYCPLSNQANSGVLCPQGYYCPTNTSDYLVFPCPPGTYGASTGLYVSTQCTQCDPGNYCTNYGQTSVSGLCAAGYYCTLGSRFSRPITSAEGGKCTAGQLCPAGSSAPSICTATNICSYEVMASSSVICARGFICGTGLTYSNPEGVDATSDYCPVGRLCQNGVTSVCPAGTFMPSAGAGMTGVAECVTCSLGKYCSVSGLSAPDMVCPAGYYCLSGQTTGTIYSCTAGFYCPEGSFQQSPCPAGKYQDTATQADCKACTTGNYCPYDSVAGTLTVTICPIGYKCEIDGLERPNMCAIGMYQDETGQTTCKSCTTGNFCDRMGMTTPTSCPAGYYCPVGSTSGKALICSPGYFCPAGATTPTICTAGYYCADYGLSAPTDTCSPGYYCLTGSKVPNPTDGIVGAICSSGNYCPDGLTMVQCPIGTYNEKTGAESADDCLQCVAGKLCLTAGLSYPTAACTAGMYCPGEGVELQCPIGYMCPAGVNDPILCLAGTYQDEAGKDVCKDCPVGKYCDFVSGITVPVDCPAGYYCPANTPGHATHPCPAGYFNPATGKALLSDCQKCTATFYCMYAGSAAVLGPCADGYLCPEGTIIPNSLSQQCPKNYYCNAGTATECPTIRYTYGTNVGAVSVDECVFCQPGMLCPTHDTGITICPAGSYCVDGAQNACPAGSSCAAGTSIPTQCTLGFYTPATGYSTCLACPDSKSCNQVGVSTPASCPTNMVCNSTSVDPIACSRGQYPNNNVCVACPAGKWCWKSATNNIMGNCNDGFICYQSADSPTPYYGGIMNSSSPGLQSYNGRSAQGCYTSSTAAAGTAANTLCLPGTYMPSTGATACFPCPPGYYCDASGMMSVFATPCPAGYYCSGGTSTAHPTDGTTGNICPAGLYCPEGSSYPSICKQGQTTLTTGQSVCVACPQGYSCTSSNPLKVCATGNAACTAGTGIEPLCALGSYLNAAGTDCLKCAPGLFCVDGRSVSAPGDCSHGQCCTAGYFCTGGSSTPKPSGSTGGNTCDAGYYCPEGTQSLKICPVDSYIFTSGARQVSDCTACMEGYICTQGSSLATACPKGNYCPTGVTGTQACPNGTYSDTPRNTLVSDCQICPAGYLCTTTSNNTGIADYDNFPCPLGLYCFEHAIAGIKCPMGTFRNNTGGTSIKACTSCLAGYHCDGEGIYNITQNNCTDGQYCPLGTAYAVACPDGYYCNNETGYIGVICPENTYCPPGSASPINCTAGQSCPEGSSYPTTCVSGQYSKYEGDILICTNCPAGTYTSSGASTNCSTCEPGYVCIGGTKAQFPWSLTIHLGYKCPKGYYCPAGSSAETPCPAGTYNPNEGSSSSVDCLLCESNTFSSSTGQEACLPCGDSATSEEGWTTCGCKGKNRAFMVSDSSCRCKPGYEYLEGGILQSDVNSKVDCQPIVYSRCDGDNIRSNDGSCKGKDACSSSCDGGSGTRSLTLGICECTDVQEVEKVCNKDCRSTMPTITVTSEGNIQVLAYNYAYNVTIVPSDIGNFSSEYMTCTSGTSCAARSVHIQSTGTIGASYGLVSGLAAQVVSQVSSRRRMLGDEEKRRLLATVSSTEITNPVMCISMGDSVVFEVDGNGHYPVYQKDSLLNTNSDFDYGPFKMLAEEMAAKIASNENTSMYFGYTFSTAGRYFFTDSIDTEKTLIVYVTKESEACATEDAYLQAHTTSSLSVYGLALNESIMLQPDYVMLVTILLTFLTTLGMLLFLMKWVAGHMWKAERAPNPKFRAFNKKFDLSSLRLFGRALKPHAWQYKEGGNDEFEDAFLEDEGVNTQKLEELDPFIIDKILRDYQSYKKYLKQELLGECDKQSREIEGLGDAIEQIKFLLNERYEKLIGLLKLDVDYTKLKNVKIRTEEEREEARRREKGLKPSDIKLRKDEEKRSVEIMHQVLDKRSEVNLEGEESRPQSVMSKTMSRIGETLEDRLKRDLEERIKTMNDLSDFETSKLRDDMASEMINLEYILAGERENQEIAIRRLLQAKRRKPAEDGKRATEAIDLSKLSPEETEEKERIERQLDDETRERARDIEERAVRRIDRARENLMRQLGIPDSMSENDKAIMLDSHKLELESALEAIKEDKDRQLDDLQKRLEKRKQTKVAECVRAMREETQPELMVPPLPAELATVDIPKEIAEGPEVARLRDEEAKRVKEAEEAYREKNTRLEATHAEEIKMKEAEVEEDLEIAVEKEMGEKQEKSEERFRLRRREVEEERRKLRDRVLFLSGNKEASEKLAEEVKTKDEKLAKLLEEEKKEQEYLLEEKINRKKVAKQRKLLAFRSAQKDSRVELRLRQLKDIQELHGQYETSRIKEIVNEFVKTNPAEKGLAAFEQLWNTKESSELAQMFGRHLAEKENRLRALYQKSLEQRLMEKQGVKDKYKRLYEELEKSKEGMVPEAYESRQKELHVEEENDLREKDVKESMTLRKDEFSARQELEERSAAEIGELQDRLVRDKMAVMRELFGRTNDDDQALLDRLGDVREAIEREKDKRIKEMELDKKIILEKHETELKERFSSYEDVIKKHREVEKLIREKKGNIERLLEERKKQMSELKDKALFTPEREKVLISKYHQELRTLESTMEAERNRQFSQMNEKIESKKGKRERERSYHEKKLAFMTGAVGKNVALAQMTNGGMGTAETELQRNVAKWRQDLEERERTQKTTTFETLQRYLDNVCKYREKGLDGIYLQGGQYQKYLKLMKSSKNLQRKLEELHRVRASGALIDLKAALRVFTEDYFQDIKVTPERIGGGYRCFDDEGGIVWELYKFVHS